MRDLSSGELDKVSGGIIVQDQKKFYVVDDKTGKIMTDGTDCMEALRAADRLGVAKKCMDTDDYEEMFGRPFHS